MNGSHLMPRSDSPNPELLRRHGWFVKAAHGEYCVVWRGAVEVVMVWQDGEWRRASGVERKAA